MKLLSLIMSILICLSTFSQTNNTDTLGFKKDSLGIVVKGEELRNFSTSNFLEAVNGVFPWVFSQQLQPNDYLFIVDDFLLQDINAISLQDIEEVRFSLNRNVGQYFPFNKSGVFLITTKKATEFKGRFRFNLQSGITLNTHASIKADAIGSAYKISNFDRKTAADKTSAPFVSYAFKIKRLNLYTSLQYKHMQQPTLSENISYTSNAGPFYYTDSVNKYGTQQKVTYLLNINYDISNTLQLKIKANYYHNNNNTDSINNYNNASTYGQRNSVITSTDNYLNIASMLVWKPFTRFTNELSVEYTNTKNNYSNNFHGNYFTPGFSNYVSQSNTNANFSYSLRLISNKINYQIVNRVNFKLSTLLDISFFNLKNNGSQFTTNSNSISSLTFFAEQKLTSLNPQVNWSVGNVLYGKIGYPLILNDYKKTLSEEAQKNPYAEVGINLSALGKLKQKVGALYLTFNYSDVAIGFQPNYLVYNPSYTQVVFSDYFARQIGINNSASFLKNKTYSFTLNYQGKGKKTQIGASWITMTKDNSRIYYNIIMGQSYYGVVNEQLHTKGLSLFINQTIINKKQISWKLRANILVPKIENEASPDIFFNPIYLYRPDNYTMQCGVQNRFEIHKFIIQANIIAGINRQYSEIVTPAKIEYKRMDEIGLSFLQVGYRFSNTKNIFFNNFNINLLAKNVLINSAFSDYYKMSKFFGIALEYNF